ncbi:MAG TPA: GDSL-type esterase/lipase family protein [Flavobacteriaceae bacterium]|nr:GDSL-type esterase/lipase family protein [Flavobacteriaceae bacterium]
MRKIITLSFLMLIGAVNAQEYVLDSVLPLYDKFINIEANRLEGAENAPTFSRFFEKLDSIYEGYPLNLHIFHIGGSHIQADIYSDKIRAYLQTMNTNAMGQRGFVFPYELAKTNNPGNYKISATKEKWQGYRNSVLKDSVAWGLSGVTAAFRDSLDIIHVLANNRLLHNKQQEFDRLRVFYNTWKDDYNLSIKDSSLVISDTINFQKQYKEFRFAAPLMEVDLKLEVKDSLRADSEFLLMGMEFLNEKPGIEYTTIGVNGASFPSYERAAFFENQLQIYKPDLFIISIGTNDGHVPASEFDPEKFKEDYSRLIHMIQRINPDCAILLTVPNDDYYKRRFANPNTALQRKVMMELAEEYNMAIWDLYTVMGGLGSSQKWYQHKLMQKDRIHFTRLGYSIKGDLLLTAIVEAWAGCLNKDAEELMNRFKKKEPSKT